MSNRGKVKKEDIQLYAEKAGLQHEIIVMLHAALTNSYTTLAQGFNIPVGTVRSRLSRARKFILEVKDNEGASTESH